MTGSEWIRLIDLSSQWGLHFARSCFWTSLGIASLFATVRVALLLVFRARLAALLSHYPGPTSLGLVGLVGGAALASAIYGALRPDTTFLTYIARDRLLRGDPAGAVEFYLPIVEWGTDRGEIYNNLAIAYVNLQRWRPAINCFKHAQDLIPELPLPSYLKWALAHEHSGEPEVALALLRKRRSLARTLEGQAAFERAIESMQRESRLVQPTPHP